MESNRNNVYPSISTVRSPFWTILGIFVFLGLFSHTLTAQDEKKMYEDFDQSNFDDNSADIDNDWMPLKPGMRYVYAGQAVEDEEVGPMPHRVVIHVTDLTKEINGVKSLATYDLDYHAGQLLEAELAFYAQDKDGNVWRMGELPVEFEDGEWADVPCWFAGVDDAVAGISMMADPWVGTPSYSQGWAPDVDFTDRGEVHEMGGEACVPMGCYDNVLVISETSLDEPGAYQLKYWAQGVGNIQVGFKGDDPTQELLELVDVMQLGADGLAEIREKALELEKQAYEHRRSRKVYGQTPPLTGLK
jgi:hypothetical protein